MRLCLQLCRKLPGRLGGDKAAHDPHYYNMSSIEIRNGLMIFLIEVS